jgi:hypothetical protein
VLAACPALLVAAGSAAGFTALSNVGAGAAVGTLGNDWVGVSIRELVGAALAAGTAVAAAASPI